MIAALSVAILFVRLYDPHHPPHGVLLLNQADEAVFTSDLGSSLGRLENVRLSQNWSTDLPLAIRATTGLISGLYTIRFKLVERPSEPTALAIARVSQSARVMLNGVLIHDPQVDTKKRWAWYEPVLIELPDQVLKAGDNWLEITVSSDSQSLGGLSQLYIGPASSVRIISDRLQVLQKPLPTFANLAVLFMAIPLALVWLHGRSVPGGTFAIYGFLSLAAALFSVRSMHVHVGDMPISAHLWLPLVGASLGWALGFFFIFLLRFVNLAASHFERIILLFVVVGSLLLFMLPQARFVENVTLFWYVPLVLMGVSCITFFCIRTLVAPDRDRVIVALALLLLVTAGVHDLLWSRGVLPFESILWTPLTMPVVLIVVCATMANRFAQTWVEADNLNRDLQQRVLDAQDQVRVAYEARLSAERRETIASERARLVEDLHDGVGGRLSVLLATVQVSPLPRSQFIQGIRECLSDLRMTITARDTGSLNEALIELCALQEHLLAAKGVELKVDCDAAVQSLTLGAEQKLNLMRIAQEAISNAARHAAADWIHLSCRLLERDTLEMQIIDNGGEASKGLNVPSVKRGLRTMQARADRLGADLLVQPSDQGWSVTLTLKVP